MSAKRELPRAGEGRAPATVSVIIPVYNHAAALRRAVESHIKQTLPPLEVVVVDDASTDDSAAVAETLSAENPSVRLIRRQARGGPNAAIGTGLAEARGDFVRFAAADDFVSPESTANAIASLEAHPDVAFCFSDPSAFDAATGRFVEIPLALAPRPVALAPAQLAALLRRNYFTISSNTIVYRRGPIAALGGFSPDLEWQADWFANLVLAFRHGACYRPEALAHFTVDQTSYGTAGVRSADGQRRLLNRCLELLDGEFADVRAFFRDAGLIPEMRLRDLAWLLSNARGRRFLTPHLAARLLAREVWTALRPAVPVRLRRRMRRLASGA